MSQLILWTSKEMNRLRRDIDRLLERLWVCFAGGAEMPGDMKGPYFDIIDEGNRLVVIAELPGASPEDVKILVKGDMLIIECKKRSVTEQVGLFERRVHRSFTTVSKQIKVPFNIDTKNVAADYSHGIFRITLPKLQVPKKRPVKIRVK